VFDFTDLLIMLPTGHRKGRVLQFPLTRFALIRESRVVHRHDIPRRNIGQDIVHLLENEAAPRSPDINVAANVLAHLRRRTLDEYIPSVASPTPKSESIAKVSLESRGIHPATSDLDRVDGVEPGFDEVREQFTHSTATMQLDPQVRHALF